MRRYWPAVTKSEVKVQKIRQEILKEVAKCSVTSIYSIYKDTSQQFDAQKRMQVIDTMIWIFIALSLNGSG